MRTRARAARSVNLRVIQSAKRSYTTKAVRDALGIAPKDDVVIKNPANNRKVTVPFGKAPLTVSRVCRFNRGREYTSAFAFLDKETMGRLQVKMGDLVIATRVVNE